MNFISTLLKLHKSQFLANKIFQNSFASVYRSHKCGNITASNIGDKIKLCGWISFIRQINSELCFYILRDYTGDVQLVVKSPTIIDASCLEIESVVQVSGIVNKRKSDAINQNMKTGEIEVDLSEFKVLNKAESLPFLPAVENEMKNMKEDLRLEYRYLDLRRPNLQNNIRKRSKILNLIRNSLDTLEFCEIETPTLFRSTSEGAHEYLVPTRQKGKFYALIQSPQQYKQLLMIAGFDKYYQIARCYRDEDLRSDRQPEFTQIDIEMSFTTQEELKNMIENLVKKIWKEQNLVVPDIFPRITYKEAMNNYGSDKPDTRFDLKLIDCSKIFKDTKIKWFENDMKYSSGFVKAINVKDIGYLSNKEVKKFADIAKDFDRPVISIQKTETGIKTSRPISFSQEELENLQNHFNFQKDDLILLVSGNSDQQLNLLGKLRLHCAGIMQDQNKIQIKSDQFNFLWVEDFPLFTIENEKITSTHHPFTAPIPEQETNLRNNQDILEVKGQHYDLVVNGIELGGGSIRIHNSDLQLKVFELLNLSKEKINDFNHLLKALQHGTPPHGGIALGFDRLMSILCGSSSLRDVIAFPKSGKYGIELMTKSPSEISNSELSPYHLKLLP